MTRTVKYRGLAIQDIDAITSRFDQVDPRISERFERAIIELAELALAHLGLGRLASNLKMPLVGARYLIPRGFRSYLMYYLATADGIHVLRVAHGARNIDQLE